MILVKQQLTILHALAHPIRDSARQSELHWGGSTTLLMMPVIMMPLNDACINCAFDNDACIDDACDNDYDVCIDDAFDNDTCIDDACDNDVCKDCASDGFSHDNVAH